MTTDNSDWVRIDDLPENALLIKHHPMPMATTWLHPDNSLLGIAQRLGAQAGDMVRGTFLRTNGVTQALDPASVEVERDGIIIARGSQLLSDPPARVDE
jgi:hypothetical protein